jgi:hypothetical protein
METDNSPAITAFHPYAFHHCLIFCAFRVVGDVQRFLAFRAKKFICCIRSIPPFKEKSPVQVTRTVDKSVHTAIMAFHAADRTTAKRP